MDSIYSIFYEKLPSHIIDLLPQEKNKLITFLNPYYMELLHKKPDLYRNFDYICSDGMIPIILNKIWNCSKSFRISFDMTSLAKILFTNIETTGESIYFIGSKQEDIEMFIHTVKKCYSQINIVGYHNGYIKNQFKKISDTIISYEPDIVVIGMGAPLQDEFAVYLHNEGFKGTIYTCGGFFHQTTKKINYYPTWINKLNLRTLYRLFKEPYIIKRVLIYYPFFILKYSAFLWKMRQTSQIDSYN